MADESQNPYWGRLSGEVKNVLIQAKRWSALAKKPRVNCDHIMTALASSYPEEVKKEVPQLSADKIKLILRKSSSPPGSNVSRDAVIERTIDIADKFGDEEIRIYHLAKAAAEYCNFDSYKEVSKQSSSGKGAIKEGSKSATPTLDTYGRDLTERAEKGMIHEIIGRDNEINLVTDTLCRVFKRNPLLVGAAGVGKTAVVEGLALRIASGEITNALKGKRVIELNMGSLLAGTKYRGMFEERLMLIIKEASNSNIILFIDEFQSVIGTGVSEDSALDASTILLPALARGEISCIGACTSGDYHKHIEKNKALDRRFQAVRIPELSHSATWDVLYEIGPSQFEKKFNINIHEDVYTEVVVLAERYMRNRYFPDKAIDILDQTVGQVVRKELKEVTIEDVRNVIGSLTGLPIGKLEDELRNRLDGMNSFLKSRILGQDHIIDRSVDIIWPNTLGVNLRPERPNGVFLFTGPTGVGKTELARALTEFLFGSPDKMIRVDMSEYSEAHTVSRLLGAPFGYQGFDEGSPFLNEISENPFSVLLLDEIEKAHPSVHRLFLQVFDSGVLTDMQRQHIYFSDVIIIMTSNILVKKQQSIGYGNKAETGTDVREQLKGHFAPEFLNRIDFIGAFNNLSSVVAQLIVETKIIPLLKKRWKKKKILLEFSPEAVELIAEKGCTEKWGARNLERTVNETINSPLAKFITGKSDTTIRILITVKDNDFEFKKIKKLFS
jgi:ATP-dependent Clp protease ATP-binding subunit ClpC